MDFAASPFLEFKNGGQQTSFRLLANSKQVARYWAI